MPSPKPLPDPSLRPFPDPNCTVDHSPEMEKGEPVTVDVSQAEPSTGPHQPGPHQPTPPVEVPMIPGYRILDEIAHGGMGRVYAGHDQTLDREVAIKTLLPGANAERFVTEAKITAKLPHPNIPPVHAMGTLPDGMPWLAMKLIRGQTLAKLLKDRSNPKDNQPRYIQIFEPIAQAVGFAHSRGIIHRDLKPLNVMVGEFGEVQVMDWGLAKDTTSRDRQGVDSTAVADVSGSLEHTAAGAILGTPGYMAPEQARGEVVDQRADVFALGSILAAILTGKPAFVGTSKLETFQQSANADLTDALTRLNTCGAEAELIDLARRCLAASPDQRPSNGQVVANEVAAYRASVEARLRQAETEAAQAQVRAVEHAKRRRQFVWAAGVVMLTLTLGLVASLWQMNRAIGAEQRANRNAEESERRLGQVQRGNAILLAVFQDLDIREQKQKKEPLEAVLASRLVQAARELEGEAVGDALDVAALQTQLGRTLVALGHARDAVPLLEKAWGTRVASGGADRPESLQTLNVLAVAYHASGHLDKALPLMEKCLQHHQEALGADHRDTLASLHNLAAGYQEAGLLDKALSFHEEALRRSRAKLGYDHPDTLASLNDLAVTLDRAGQSARALPLREEVVRLRRAKLGPDHPDTLSSMNNLALSYGNVGDVDKAVQLHEEVLQLQRAKLGRTTPTRSEPLATSPWPFVTLGSPTAPYRSTPSTSTTSASVPSRATPVSPGG